MVAFFPGGPGDALNGTYGARAKRRPRARPLTRKSLAIGSNPVGDEDIAGAQFGIGRAGETDVPDLGRLWNLHGGGIGAPGAGAVRDGNHGPVKPYSLPHPVHGRWNDFEVSPFRHPRGAFARVGSDENDRRAHAAPARFTCFTRSNHSTARASATCAGCGE